MLEIMGLDRHTGAQRNIADFLHMCDKDVNATLRRASDALNPSQGNLL